MNQTEMAQRLHEKTGIEKRDCLAVVAAIFNPESGLISDALAASEEVRISEFGVFARAKVAGRTGTAPGGEPYSSPPHHRPTFRPADAFKRRIFA